MKKLLIVNNNLKIGGIQKALINMLNEIYYEYDITLLLFTCNGELVKFLPNNIKIIVVDSHYKYLGYSRNDLKNKKISYIIRGLYSFFTKLFGFKFTIKLISLTQKKIKNYYDYVISYSHCSSNKSFYSGCAEFVLKHTLGNYKACFIHCDYVNSGTANCYNNKTYKKFDKIICVSQSVKKQFLSIIPELNHKTYVLRNFINYNEIIKLSKMDEIKYDNKFINIISVSRLTKEKGIDRAILAIKECKVPIKYYIIGDGIEKKNLIKLVCEYNMHETVIFCGEQENPYRYMQNADLLLVPSFHEASPLVYDEAKLLGLFVLTTETTSAKEIFDNDISGYVCKNTQESLVTSLTQVTLNINYFKKNLMMNHKYSNDIQRKQLVEIFN